MDLKNDEMKESLEQVRALSKIMGGDSDDMSQKIAMAQKLSSMMSKESNDEKIQKISSSGDRNVDILSAALPYINSNFQKPFSILINIMQIKAILKKGVYQPNNISMAENGQDKRKLMIKAVMPYLESEQRKNLNMIWKLMEMMQTMNILGESAKNE